jgi:NADPH:quinone reductase-like Zn-dependent oxidoreductase
MALKEIKSETRFAKEDEKKPWHTFLTLDLIIAALNKTFLHPFVAWMIPLSLRAVATPYQATSFQITVAYASLLTLWFFLDLINKSIAYGPARDVDFEEEVILITGGAGGLGLVIAEMYGMRGASVAVMDVKDVAERENDGIRGVKFYKCDIEKRDEVEQVKAQIEKEVRTCGNFR